MDSLIHRIVENVGANGFRLTAVINPDGFLSRPDTQENVLRESGLLLLPVRSSIELRVRYESTDRWSEDRVCYIIEDLNWILPDLRLKIYQVPTFSLPKLFPALNAQVLMGYSLLSFAIASYLYSKNYTYNLSAKETQEILMDAQHAYGVSKEELIQELDSISLDWNNTSTIEEISRLICKALKYDLYEELEDKLSSINTDFQKYIDAQYFSKINSSAIPKPKMVNKILPYIARTYSRDEKVALVVIDGMAYWQYLLLEAELHKQNIATINSFTFAWLPSITKLSRQAIFKGNIPQVSYSQSPQAEKTLWEDFWTSQSGQKRFDSYNIGYTHGSLSIDNNNKSRQALVETSLDDKMHAVANLRELYILTEEWAKDAATDIKALYDMGYQIYITTDHGNIQASPWRLLTSQEKTFLYEKESRGRRHLIYSDNNHLNRFISEREDIKEELLIKENWAVWRNTRSFSNKPGITHGGSHFMEVVIPFITINKK